MSFSGTTARATAECAGTVSTSAEGVSTSAGAVCSLTEALQLLQKLFAAFVGAILASVEAAAASAGVIFGVFG